MGKIVVASVFLWLCGAASAAPVYLDCVTKVQNPKPGAASEFRFSLKADEASGNVTHNDADGSAFNTKGFFSANEISYQHVNAGSSFTTTTVYQIDRTNLSVLRTFNSELSEEAMDTLNGGRESRHSITTSGICRIADVKKRKI
jgi:hypothetical protein